MALALVDPVNYPLLSVVVVWATCLFRGYGLLEVIVDLSDPYFGLFQVSPHPLTDVLKAISWVASAGARDFRRGR